MSLTRSSVVVSLLTAISMALNVVLNVVTAYAFGASQSLDAYLAAITVPTYIVTILAGMMTVTVIPAFVAARETDQTRAWSLVSALINLAAIGSVLFVVVGMTLAPWIMRGVAPGFSDSLQSYSADLLRLYFPWVALSVVNEIMASIYYAHGRFVAPLLNKTITPLVSIAFVLAFGGRLDAMSLVLASLVGVVLQCVNLGWGFLRDPAFHYRFSLRSYTDDVRQLLRRMLPLGASMMLYKIVPIFDRYIMSGSRSGSISTLNYASRLQLFAVQIISASISLAVFPVMARQAAQGNKEGLKATTSKVISVLFFVSVPIAVLTIVFGESLLRLFFQRGAFTPEVLADVDRCLVTYMISLPIVVTGSVVSQGLYVLQDTRTIALLGVAETAIYLALCFALVGSLGILVVPVVYGIYFTLSVIALGARFRHLLRLGGGGRLLAALTGHVLLGVAIGALAWVVKRAAPASDILALMLFGAGGLSFLVIAKLLGIAEATLIWSKVRGFLARR